MDGTVLSLLAGIIAGATGYLAYRATGIMVVPWATASLCALAVVLRQDVLTRKIEAFTTQFTAAILRWSEHEGRAARFVFRPMASLHAAVDAVTTRIEDYHVRIGTRAAAAAIVAEGVVIAALLLGWLALGLILTVAVFWILGRFFLPLLTGYNPTRRAARPFTVGTSRLKKPLLGDAFEEFVDEDGTVVQTAHKKRTLFGEEYTDIRDPSGESLGTARARESLFGDDFVEMRDTDGEVLSESRIKKPILADPFIETKDRDGNVIRETRDIQPLFGDRYREHREP